MKGFSVDETHDIVIKNGVVQLVEGSELKRQSTECTLNTKKGEWFFDISHGIDFNAILGKREVDIEEIRNIIMDGLTQVDDTFTIDNLTTNYDKKHRKLTVEFTATTESGESITLSQTWG